MTPRERINTALSRGQPDRVPLFDTPNNPLLFERALGAANLYSEAVPTVRLSRALGMDACLVLEAGYTGLIARRQTWIDEHHFVDELGVRFAVGSTSWPLASPETPSLTGRDAWARIKLGDPLAPWRQAEIRAAVAECHRGRSDDLAVFAGMRSPFSVLTISMGLESLAVTLYEDPALIDEMVETLGEFWTRASARAAENGADAVFIANDMGFNTQTILPPDAIRKHFMPQLGRQIRAVQAAGARVILHSCGNVNAILPDIVETGADCLNPLQVAADMDIGDVKRRYGVKLALQGNVDSTKIMTDPDPRVIERAVIRTLRAAAPGGGHILSTDHSFHMGIPLASVDAFLAAGKKWGTYPLALPAAEE